MCRSAGHDSRLNQAPHSPCNIPQALFRSDRGSVASTIVLAEPSPVVLRTSGSTDVVNQGKDLLPPIEWLAIVLCFQQFRSFFFAQH
jgi:hypothetical protein